MILVVILHIFLFFNYLKSSNYKYNEYPFDINNNEIKDEKLKRNYNYMNDFFLDKIPRKTEGVNSLNNKYEIIFSRKFYLKIGGLIIEVRSLFCPKFKDSTENMSIFKLTTNESYKRPIVDDYLLGMNVISKLKITINPISDDYSLMKFEYPDRYKNEKVLSSFHQVNSYEIVMLKSSLNLFYNGSNSEIYNTVSNNYEFAIFGLVSNYKYNNDPSNSTFGFKTTKPLNLILLPFINYNRETIIKKFITDNENIDGYISIQNNIDGSYNYLMIWLKNSPTLFLTSIELENINDERRDILIFEESKIVSWFIN